MRICTIFLLVSLSVTIFKCGLAADAQIDEAKDREKQQELMSAFTNTTQARFDRLTFFYVGPFGWSKPESRLVIGRGPNATIDYLKLSKHIDLIASEMVDGGEKDVWSALKNGANYQIKIPLTNCPGVLVAIDELEDTAVAEIANDRRLDSQEKMMVVFDGGGSYNFHFGEIGVKEFSYVSYIEGPMSKKMTDLENLILSCAK